MLSLILVPAVCYLVDADAIDHSSEAKDALAPSFGLASALQPALGINNLRKFGVMDTHLSSKVQ